MSDEMRRRIALLTRLVERAPDRSLGRTAIMKLLYFLVTVRRVPLGYYYTLYSYGPFDSTVLQDVDYAARLDALDIHTEMYPSGYGYVIKPGAAAEEIKSWAARFVAEHEDDIDWVMREFGNLNASELELSSTIVYMEQEWGQVGYRGTIPELVDRVSEIKPHFSRDAIQRRAESLRQRRIITSVN